MSNKLSLKQFIMEEYLPESNREEIGDDLNLIENGILDSLAVLKLVAYIEDSYNISLDPSEIDPDNLSTINAIDSLICSKSGKYFNAFILRLKNLMGLSFL